MSYLQNIKAIAKPFTDKVRSYADAIRNKIDDLCGNAKDKIKVTATSLKLFDNIDDVVKLFDRANPSKTININGKVLPELSDLSNSNTTKVFEGATDAEIKQYAESILGKAIDPHPTVPGIWTGTLNGTKVNLRDISSSKDKNKIKWTVEVYNDLKITPLYNKNKVEIKFR